jgi:hypothetical protein
MPPPLPPSYAYALHLRIAYNTSCVKTTATHTAVRPTAVWAAVFRLAVSVENLQPVFPHA